MDEGVEMANQMLSKAMGRKVNLDLGEAKAIVEISEHTGTARETVTRRTAEHHETIIAQRVSTLEGKNKTLQEALDRANILDKQLHDQIEELSVPFDDEEATRGEIVAALDAAESGWKDLECENKRLRHSIEELQRESTVEDAQEVSA